jgi:hypothetical protein
MAGMSQCRPKAITNSGRVVSIIRRYSVNGMLPKRSARSLAMLLAAVEDPDDIAFEIAQDAQVRSVIRGMPMTDVDRGDALRHAQGNPPQQSVRRGAEQSAAAGSAIPRLLSRAR